MLNFKVRLMTWKSMFMVSVTIESFRWTALIVLILLGIKYPFWANVTNIC